MNDLVSVIIPVYKVEPYLRECLDSVINQTYRNLEIILVDDGSPDECPKICDEYAERDSRVKVIHKENGGLSDARNKGIDIATGEYITFVDSDDVIHEIYVESLYDNLKKTNSDISVCQSISFNDSQKIKEIEVSNERYVLSGNDAVQDLYKRLCRIKKIKSFGVGVTAWGKMFARKIFSNIRFPYGMLHEDDAVSPKVLYQSNSVCVISSRLYCYRVTDNSIMNSPFSIKRYDCLDAIESCAVFFREKNEKKLYELALIRKKYLLYQYAFLAKHNGIYSEVPKQYHVHFVRDVFFLKKYLNLSWKEPVAFYFPKLYQKYLSYKRKMNFCANN